MIWCKTDVKNWNYYEITRLWCHESNWRPHQVELVLLSVLSFFLFFFSLFYLEIILFFKLYPTKSKYCLLFGVRWELMEVCLFGKFIWHIDTCIIRCITVSLLWCCQCAFGCIPISDSYYCISWDFHGNEQNFYYIFVEF